MDKQIKKLPFSLSNNNELNIYKNNIRDFSNQKQKQLNDFTKNKFNENIEN